MKTVTTLDQEHGIPTPLLIEIDDNGNAWLVINTVGPLWQTPTRRFRVMVEEQK